MAGLFEKGNCANPNGRPKGSKNHKGFDVTKILKDLNYCPFTHLYQMAIDPTWSKRERTQAVVELCSYVAAKLKSIELSSAQQQEIAVSLNCAPNNKKEEILQEITEEYPGKNG